MNKREKEVVMTQLEDEKKSIAKLKKSFNEAKKQIKANIEALDARTDMTNIQSIVHQKRYQQEILKQINGVLKDLNNGQYETLNDFLEGSYSTGYIGTMYNLQSQGIPMTVPVDPKKMVRAITTDSQLSKKYYQKREFPENITTLKKNIQVQLTAGVASGASWKEMAYKLTQSMKTPFDRAFNDAVRIMRTEGHRVQQQGHLDACHVAKDKGADIVKQWDSTLDGYTRPWHREADGQIRELDDDFIVMGEKLKAPSIGGSAKNVVNCRCQLLQRAKWALDDEELEILKQRAEFYGLDKTDQFEEFKSKYMKVQSDEIIENIISFTPSKTIKDAEEFASQFFDTSGFGSVGLSYQGVGLDVANEINQGLNILYNTFNVKKLGGISAPAKNTKIGKQINATMAYSPIRRSILLNRSNTKNVNVFTNFLLEDKNALNDLLNHPEKYNWSKLSPRVQKVVENSKETGRAIVPDNIQESLFHEFGHFLEDSMSKEEFLTLTEGIDEFGSKISGYACESRSEYVAESFASYMKGENKIDPLLEKFFNNLRKK